MKHPAGVFIAIMVMAAPMSSQIIDPPKPAFEGVYMNGSPPGSPGRTAANAGSRSISTISTPSGSCFATRGITLKTLIAYAYDLPDFKIIGGPDWIATQRFDVEAQVSAARGIPQGVQSILAARFHLQAHRETQDAATYSLVIAPGGPNSAHLTPNPSAPGRTTSARLSGNGDTTLSVIGISPIRFVDFLSVETGVPVTDRTGLNGQFNFDLHWTRDPNLPSPSSTMRLTRGRRNLVGACLGTIDGSRSRPVMNPNGPSIFKAIEEQLGLLLQPDHGPVEFLVIDHAEKPVGTRQ